MNIEAGRSHEATPPGSAVIVFNPEAGTGSAHKKADRVKRAVTQLERRGWRVAVATTTRAGQEGEIAQKAIDEGATAIFAAGGDGTVNKMLPTLIRNHSVALGVLPWGTVNLWARETGIPKKPEEAIDTQLGGDIGRMDVGFLDGKPFRNLAGIGFDGDVLQWLDGMKTRNGHRLIRGSPLYFASTAIRYPGFRPTEANIMVGDQESQTSFMQAWIGNTKLLAYMELRPEARVDDGLVEVTVLPKMNPLELVRTATPALMRSLRSQPGQRVSAGTYYQGAEGQIETRKPLYAQIDGETLSTRPMPVFEIGTKPGALTVFVPRNQKTEQMFS
jgi:diacylglycerol kinase (ATP)